MIKILNQLSNKKGISNPLGIIIFLVVIIIVGVLAWQFWPKGETYVKVSPSPATTSPTVISSPLGDNIEADCGSWESPDRQKIALCNTRDDFLEISVHHYSTGQSKVLFSYGANDPCAAEWDPWLINSKYLILHCGTSPVRSRMLYNVFTGEEAGFFQAPLLNFVWLSEDELVYLSLHPVVPTRGWGSGEGKGISILNLVTGEKKVLQQPTGLKEYADLEVINGNIKISLIEIQSQDDWSEAMTGTKFTTHWLMNKDGQIIEQLK